MAFATIDLTKGVTGVLPSANATYSTPRSNSKPLIINGDMAVSQRTTSTTIANDGLVTDRFKHQISHDGATTVSQENLSSGNAFTNGFANALKIDVTTADSSLSASQRYFLNYSIEGQDIQNIKKGTASAEKLTLAFWVKATKTGTNVVRCYTPDSDRSCSQSYTISSTNTWEHKVLNFPADTTGTVIADDNTSGAIFTWGIAVGSNYTSGSLQTTWGANTSANDYVGQVNHLDSTSNNFHLTGVQLEVGEFTSSTIPPFQHEDFGDNLARCQRYHTKITRGVADTSICTGRWYNNSNVGGMFHLPTSMRSTPTLSITTGTNYYNASGTNANNYFDDFTFNDAAPLSVGWYKGSISGTQGDGIIFMTGNSNASVSFDSEL